MSYQEKKSVVSIITAITVLLFYSIYVYNNYLGVSAESLNDLSLWATLILIMIPIRIVTTIFSQILFAIINKIATNEDMPSGEDEFDKLIEIKSSYWSHMVFILGFIIGMIFLSMDKQPYLLFLSMLISGFCSEMLQETLKIKYYRRGFAHG